jgi:hypothetical protein
MSVSVLSSFISCLLMSSLLILFAFFSFKVKMDWCGHPEPDKVVYPRMSKAINATGRKMAFGMCSWGLDNVWEWAGDYANQWRIGPDQ